jgi:hypothetical protein
VKRGVMTAPSLTLKAGRVRFQRICSLLFTIFVDEWPTGEVTETVPSKPERLRCHDTPLPNVIVLMLSWADSQSQRQP